MLNIFYSFWYGKVTLWKAYWLVGELLNVVVMLVIFNIEIYNNIFYKNSFAIRADYFSKTTVGTNISDSILPFGKTEINEHLADSVNY